MKKTVLKFNPPPINHTIIAVSAIAILVIGIFFYLAQKKELERKITDGLKSIAELKASELNTWINDRLKDAEVIVKSPNTYNRFYKLVNQHNNEDYSQLLNKIQVVKEINHYQDVFLLNGEGKILVSTNREIKHLSFDALAIIAKAIKNKKAVISDIYYCTECQDLHLDFVEPFIKLNQADHQPFGFVLLRISPEKYLFSFLSKWPTLSSTGETVLVKKEMDSVVFINSTRHSPNKALKIKLPLSNKKIAAVNAALGNYGLFYGVDYRNVPVLSYSTPIQGTSWIIIAKQDVSEIFAPLKSQGRTYGIFLVLYLVILIVVFYQIRSKEQKIHYKKLFELELERKILVSHFEHLVKHANDIILLVNESGQIVEANNSALKTYQYELDELKNLNVCSLWDSKHKKVKNKPYKLLDKEDNIYETFHYRRDGEKFPVEISEKIIEIEGVRYYQAIIRDITDRKKAESQLRSSEEKYRTLIESSESLIITVDANGVFHFVNQVAANTFNIPPNELLGKTINEVFSASLADYHLKSVRQVISTKRGIINETMSIVNGTYRWYRNSIQPLLDDTGEVKYALVNAVDISDRKKIEIELKEKEVQYRNLADSGVALIWTSGADKKCNYFNKTWLEFTGRTLEQELGDGWAEGVHSDDLTNCINTYVEAFDARKPFEMEYRLRNASGEYRWIRDMGTPNYNSTGEFVGYIGHCFDITDRKQIEQKLILNEQTLKLFVEYAPASIAMFDRNMVYLAASNRYKADFNLADKEIIGQSHYEIFPEMGEERIAVHKRCLAGANEKSEEDKLVRLDGSIQYVRWEIHPWYQLNSEIGGIVFFSEVITESVVAKEKLKLRENTLNLFIEYAPASIAMFDKEMKYISASKRFIESYHLAETPLIGRSHYEVFPEITDEIKNIHKRCLQGEILKSDEDLFPRLDGTQDWVRWEVHPWFERSGEIGGIILFSEVITERKNFERKIRESENQLSTIFNSSPIGIMISQPEDGIIINTNKAFADIHGYQINELIGKSSFNLGLWVNLEARNEILKKIENNSMYKNFETQTRKKNGDIIDVDISIEIIEVNGKELVLSAVQDITERKQLVANQVKLVERLDLATKASQIGIWDWDIQKNELIWDEQMYALYGLKPDEFGGAYEAWLKGVHPDDREKSNKESERALNGEIEYDTEFRVVWPDGTIHWLKANGHVFRNEQGEPIRMVGVNFDITERKQIENTNQESANRFATLFHSNPTAIGITYPPDYRIFDVNDAWCKLTGYSREEAIGHNSDELRLAKPETLNYLNTTINNLGEIPQTEIQLYTRTGDERHVLFKSEPIEINGKKFFLNNLLDLTERIKAERIVRESEQFARSTLNGLSAHIAIVDHDGVIVAVNNAWRNFAENNPTALSNVNEGANYLEVCDKASGKDALIANKVSKVIKDILSGSDDTIEIEYPCHSPEEQRWFIARFSKFPGEGQPRVIVAHENITELKKVENALIQSEETHRFLFDHNPIPMWVYESDTFRFLRVNEVASLKYGYSQEEFLGMTLKDIRPAEDVQILIENATTIEKDRIQRSGPWRHVLKGGDIILVEIHSHSLTFEGRNARLVAVYDITERLENENKIKKSEERFRSTLDNMIEGCQIIGFDWRYIYINHAAEMQNQRPNSELIGKIYTETWPGVENTEVYKKMKSCMEERIAYTFENEFIFPNGIVGWYNLSIQPVSEGIFILSVDITEEKLAQLASKQKDELLHLTGNMAKVGGWEFDVSTMQGTWTDEVAIIHDLDPGQSTNVELGLSFYLAESRQKIKNAISEAIKNATPYDLELEMNSAKGVHKWVRTIGIPIKNEKGVYKVRGIFQDITDQKNAIERLKQSEDRFRTLVESAPEAIFIQTDSKFAYVNPATIRLFKAESVGNLLGKPVIEYFHPDNRDQVRQRINSLNKLKSEVPSVEEKCITLTGEEFAVEVSAVPFSYENNDGALVFLHNITDRKRAEFEIKKINAELETRVKERTAEVFDLYNNAPCGYHSLNEKGFFIHVNDTELKWLGYSRDELIGKINIIEILTDQSKKVFAEIFPKFKKMGFANDVEISFIKKDGTSLSTLLSATAVFDDNQNFIMSRSTIIDNTNLKQAKDEIIRAKDSIEQANKELEAFSYSVSHDLRAPLRAIHGFINILAEDFTDKLDDEAKRLMSIVQKNTTKMGQLIDDLLAFSRLGRAVLQRNLVDNNELVKSIIDEMFVDKEKGKVNFICSQLPTVEGDKNMLQQVWINLLSNAVKYSSNVESPQVEVGFTARENEIEFFVKDNGAGFDMKYADKLFGVFQRLHNEREFEGTGVGLALVHRIITRHGGSVKAYGEIDKGATFSFILPKKQ